MDTSGELQCVGRLAIAAPPPARYLRVGSLPVPTDDSASLPALLPYASPTGTGAPRYQMLPLETDLNTLPMIPNFPEKVFPTDAKSTEGLRYGSGLVNQNLSRKCEALAVSGLAEYGDEIDVIAPTDILKQIFKIPYSKAHVSIAVNRIGDTHILNTGPDVDEGEKIFRRQNNQPKGSDPSILKNFAMHSVRAEACACPPSHQPSQDKQTASMLHGPFGHRADSFASPSSSTSSYLDQNVSKSRKPSHGACESLYWGVRENKQKVPGSDPIRPRLASMYIFTLVNILQWYFTSLLKNPQIQGYLFGCLGKEVFKPVSTAEQSNVGRERSTSLREAICEALMPSTQYVKAYVEHNMHMLQHCLYVTSSQHCIVTYA